MTTTFDRHRPSIELLMQINAASQPRRGPDLSFFADDATFLMARGPGRAPPRPRQGAIGKSWPTLQGHPRHALGPHRTTS